jgi:hypothetical protein
VTFLETALDLASRGFYVFPLKPRDKWPIVAGGFKAATRDAEQLALWWKRTPDANIGIACGASVKAVLDCDHGFTCLEDFIAWRDRNGLPATYTVRTGRRPEFAVQSYYQGAIPTVIGWEHDGASGDIKSEGGLVVAPPSIHPDSGEAYAVVLDLPIAPIPDKIKWLTAKPSKSSVDSGGGIETENRNQEMCSFIGRIRKQMGVDELECLHLCRIHNDRYTKGPMPDEEVEKIVTGQYQRYPNVGPDPVVTIGSGKPEENKITDWRERYLTFEQVRDAKPVEFLIDGFLALDSITAIAAPVGQRKSLIALNVAHALCTGEPLFDYFKVVKRPSRVIYLCPEMGISSFSMRLKQIGLASHVGQTLFCQTMDVDSIKLTDLDEELPGSVVIVDTLTRFVQGDQNSSEDMSRFAKVVFKLQRGGASVVLLHHSIKGTSNSSGLTLDSAMRGSTELAAFVTCCWATRLQDPDEPYNSPSLLVNVKQRDFESKPFEATSDKTCRMHMIGEPGQMTEIKEKADDDAKAALALILTESPKAGIHKLRAELKAAGHTKGVKWVTKARAAILGTGVSASA